MSIKVMTLDEVRIKGMRSLSRELGPYDFVRFFQQYISGYGDYTKERESILTKKICDPFKIAYHK